MMDALSTSRLINGDPCIRGSVYDWRANARPTRLANIRDIVGDWAAQTGDTANSDDEEQQSEENCAHRNPDGTCVYRRDENGMLQFTLEHELQTCMNFDLMQQSNQQISDLSLIGAGVAGLDALTGGSLPALNSAGKFVGAAGVVYFSAVTGVTTRLLAGVERPGFCQ